MHRGMSREGIWDVCIMWKRAEVMGVGNGILEWFIDQIKFTGKLLRKSGLPGNGERMSMHAFMT